MQGLEDRFSKRETQVLHLMIGGFTSHEIGISLNLSPRTVEMYRVLINRKLDEPSSSFALPACGKKGYSPLAA